MENSVGTFRTDRLMQGDRPSQVTVNTGSTVSMCRPSKIDVSPFEDRCHDVSTFGDRCVDFRRSMCRPSEMDVLTFEDR